MKEMLYAGLCLLTAGADPTCPEMLVNPEPPAQVQPYQQAKAAPTSLTKQESLEARYSESLHESMDDDALN